MRMALLALVFAGGSLAQKLPEPPAKVLMPTQDTVELLRLTVENNKILAEKAKSEADKAASQLATAQEQTRLAEIAAKATGIDNLITKLFGFLGIGLTGIAIPFATWWLKKRSDEITKNSAAVVKSLGDVHTAVAATQTSMAENTAKTVEATTAANNASADVKQLQIDRKETATAQNAAIERVHLLVNSNLTQSKTKELSSDEGNLASLLEVVDLKRKAGLEPSKQALEAIEHMRVEIAELKAELSDRKQQTEVAAAQIKEDIHGLPETPEKEKLEPEQ